MGPPINAVKGAPGSLAREIRWYHDPSSLCLDEGFCFRESSK